MAVFPSRRRMAAGLAAALLAATPAAADFSPSCALPDAMVALNGDLGRTMERFASGRTVTILAIGSSSTEGVGATAPDRSYPVRLDVELDERLPGARIDVVNAGRGGEVASTTVQRMREEVERRDPDLVIWQLGTNDALRGVGREAFDALVADGLAWLDARGTDVVLVDPQLFPRIEGDEGYSGFVRHISTLAGKAGVPVVRRFDAMRHWGGLPEAARRPMLAADAFHMNDQGYACLAEMLAEGLARRLAGTAAIIEAAAPAGAAVVQASTAP